MQRRTFLKGSGAVLVLVTGGGVWRAYDRGVFSAGHGPAYEPWRNWRDESKDGPLVRAAILAASAVNTQPWLFKVTASSIELHADKRRNTGAFDPYLRELHISLGCALENLMLAAEVNRYKAPVSIVPGNLDGMSANPGTDLVARLTLEPGERKKNELYDAIPRRHTNRLPFDAQRPVSQDFVAELNRGASDETDVKLFLFTADEDRRKVVDVLGNGAAELSSYPDMFRESARWFRDWNATQRAGGLWYEQSQNIRAGRLWQRAHLLATARSLAARPANQTPELVDQERLHGQEPKAAAALATVTGDATWQTTFMFYMGYATREAHATVRRPVGDVIT